MSLLGDIFNFVIHLSLLTQVMSFSAKLSMFVCTTHWLNPLHLFNVVRQSLGLNEHPKVS